MYLHAIHIWLDMLNLSNVSIYVITLVTAKKVFVFRKSRLDFWKYVIKNHSQTQVNLYEKMDGKAVELKLFVITVKTHENNSRLV